jgi:hypothetical protein
LNLDSATTSYSIRLDLNGTSFNAMKAMLAFLYTGEVDHQFMEHRGLDLLLAAHKVKTYHVYADVAPLRGKKHFLTHQFLTTCRPQLCFNYTTIFIFFKSMWMGWHLK